MFEKVQKNHFLRALTRAGGVERLVATEILSTVEVWLVERFGKQVLTMCSAKSVSGNTIRIKSMSAPLSREIQHQQEQLLAHILEEHPRAKIDRVQIVA